MSFEATIALLDTREEPLWDAYAAKHVQGTIYHSLAWRSVTREGLGHESYYLRASDAGGNIVGILPLFLVTGIMGRRLVSVPMRDRGGLLADTPAIAALLIARAIELTRDLKCKYLEIRSLEDIDPKISHQYGLHIQKTWITTRIDLAVGVDRLWRNLPGDSGRRSINRAYKKGLRIELDGSSAAIDTFYALFARTRSHLGIPVFPKALFSAIWKHLIARDKANLFMVRKGSEPVDAMINLLSHDTFIAGYAAPQNEWRRLYPNDLMYWSTIKWAVENGYHFYDFGADSPRQTGLLHFKRKWGGVHHAMSYSYYLNGPTAPPVFDSSTQKYAVMRQLWTVLPTPLSIRLGSWVTRQLS